MYNQYIVVNYIRTLVRKERGVFVNNNLPVSETVTENLFRDFYGATTFIEKSAIPKEYGFRSKNEDSDEKGYPDFFLDKDEFDFVIVVEAKAENHKDAISDIKLYLKENNITQDIIGIAVSGQKIETLKVSYFLYKYVDRSISKIDCDSLVSLEKIKKMYIKHTSGEKSTIDHLVKTLNALNKQFQNEAIIRDTDRSLFFSGIMIALKDPTFRASYRCIQKPTEQEAMASDKKMLETHNLSMAIVEAINRQLNVKVNNLSKEYEWRDRFSFIKTIDYSLIKFKELIKNIESNIFAPFENEEKQDILGRAYKIFLSKAGKVDNKNIILTPDHIKRLMIKLAKLSPQSVLLDTCTGSGGFLMEGMETMLAMVGDDEKKRRNIFDNQLIGFEVDPVLFTLACSNMFLHGDGRSKLLFRSSLLGDQHQNIVYATDEELMNKIKEWKPDTCVINPPYENNKPILFVKQALDYLVNNGRLIVIMPTPTLTHNQGKNGDGLTEEILKIASLKYVIRMPERLFSEQGRTVNTSIFCFEKTPHRKEDKVLFYDMSDDGHVSIQHKGRLDIAGRWSKIEADVLDAIFNSNEIEGKCDKRLIYDGDKLNCAGFRQVKNSKFTSVKMRDLFIYSKGNVASEQADEAGEYDLITASNEWKKHSEYQYDEEALVYAVSASGSLGRTHYVNGKFSASNLCIILFPSGKYKIHLAFYKYYLEGIKERIRLDLADGTSKLTINPEELMDYYVEYIPYDEQVAFYEKNIKPLEDIEIQKKQIESGLVNNLTDMLS